MRARLALALLGAWLGVLLASWAAATLSLRVVDRALGPAGREELAARLSPVASDDRRAVLRHLAAESNRSLFRGWAVAQLFVGSLVLALLGTKPGTPRWLAAAALVIVIGQAALGRPITSLGRAFDFVPRPLPGELGRRFGLLHGAFVLLDLVKAGLLAAATGLLARR